MKLKVRFIDLDVVDCTADPHPVGFKSQEELLEAILRVCRSPLVEATEGWRRQVEEEIRQIKERLSRGERKLHFSILLTWAFAGEGACSDEIVVEDLDTLVVDFRNTDWYRHHRNYLAHLKDLGELLGCDLMHTAMEGVQVQYRVGFTGREDLLEAIERVCESDLVKGIQKVHLALGSKEYKTDYYSSFAGKLARGAYAKKHKVEGLFFLLDMEDKGVAHLPPGLTGLREALKLVQERKVEERTCLIVDLVWSLGPDPESDEMMETIGRIRVEGPALRLQRACFAAWFHEEWDEEKQARLSERLIEVIGKERLRCRPGQDEVDWEEKIVPCSAKEELV